MDTLQKGYDWFQSNNWEIYPFQKESWEKYAQGYSGLVNAPTGSGKTYSLFVPAMLSSKPKKGLKVIWVTPIRALAKEICNACVRAAEGMNHTWKIEIRTGDTSTSVRQKQWKDAPDILITTPESIHVMMATKGYTQYFQNLEAIIVDEWHELVGSKRGVQIELAISRLRNISKNELKIWGISATIGNLEEAMDILLGINKPKKYTMIRAGNEKKIEVRSILPEKINSLPWAGHLGLNMAHHILPLIQQYNSTLIFTNTRAQCEIWYQKLLDLDENLAGIMAMHHGSISKELRDWVEDALYEGKLKVVVCTSSLELGVDFRPVENIIQIGSPKGVARFMQRAGRSGHQPGAVSHAYFLPTHAIELIEIAGLRQSIANKQVEARIPYLRSFDVLIQYLMTLAVSDGFKSEDIYPEIVNTFNYASVTIEEWNELLSQMIYGAKALEAYDEYHKMEVENGIYKVTSKAQALRHRLSIGTIVSDAMIHVKYQNGMRLGSIEEYFISLLKPGDLFWFAGRSLELVRFKDMTAYVINASSGKGKIPSYMGGRMSFSSEMSKVLKQKLDDYHHGIVIDPEIEILIPLLKIQEERSKLPKSDEFLIEVFESKEGWHISMFPFEGRSVHEGMAALIAQRLGDKVPVTFSISMNDYGFELLTDAYLDFESLITHDIFSTKNLFSDIQASLNAVELAKRKFRDIAIISGLVFTGYPNKIKKERHLQSSSELLFNVFHDYDPENLLYRQTYEEVMTFQLEEARMRDALTRIQHQKLCFTYPQKPTPLAFPLIVDRLREKMSTEQLEDRIRKMMEF
jgi:ATP-dependent helicase Lhr and Lhr-like helicase